MTNKHGARCGRPTSAPKRAPLLPAIKLHLLLDAPDPDGMPRAALEIPASPGPNRHPTLLLFTNITAALAAKQRMEAGQ